MTENNEKKRIDGYIRGTLFPGYEGYCPITPALAYKQDNGKWMILGSGVEDNDVEIEIERSDIIESPGFLLVQLGIDKEHTHDVAAAALLNSMESLFAACGIPVDYERIRTTVEFSEFMKIYRCNYSHIILLGHGSDTGLTFLDKREPIAGEELAGYLGADKHKNSIQLISLCCHSGCEKMASALSRATSVTEVIAPRKTFDLRWAVHFITGYFLALYVSGNNLEEAVKKTSGVTLDMCIWRNGVLAYECNTDQNV